MVICRYTVNIYIVSNIKIDFTSQKFEFSHKFFLLGYELNTIE